MIDKLINMNRSFRIGIFLFIITGSFLSFAFTGELILLLISLISIVLLIYSNVQYEQRSLPIMENVLEKTLVNENFKADYSYISDDYLSGIALNENQNKILLLMRSTTNDQFTSKTINYEDLIESSIKEDEFTVTKSSKGSMIGSAIAGGVVAGGIGAIVGGINADKITKKNIRKSSLLLVLNDKNNPVFEIKFLNSPTLIDSHSEVYRNIYSELVTWHKRLSLIIRDNELNKQSI